MDILTGKNLSISVASIDLIHWSVCSSRDGVNGWMEYKVIIASCEYHFIRVHENLVQHLSNNIIYRFLKAIQCFLVISIALGTYLI